MKRTKKFSSEIYQEQIDKDVLFFWKEGNGPGYMSQWHRSSFTDESGNVYSTAEQWMMAEKARLFNDETTLKKILKESSPKKVKQLGREVRGFKDKEWRRNRERIVYEGNYMKFTQNPDLHEKLLSTGDSVLVEASPVDKIWGIGLRASDPKARNISTWKGLNLLGRILMTVRNDIKN